jgi:hypothetical protein
LNDIKTLVQDEVRLQAKIILGKKIEHQSYKDDNEGSRAIDAE